MIRLLLLGSLDLRDSADVELRSVLAQPKRTALLAHLAAAVPRGWHRRDTLLALFWPERDGERGRAALSKAVHHLRRALGEDAIEGRGIEELRLNPERVWCDVAAFDDAVDAGAPKRALELYRGELLAGFHLSDAPQFERWLDAERARLLARAHEAGWAAAEAAEQRGDVALAVERARRATALAWHDERGVRRLIALLDRAGDRAGALAAYEEFTSRMAEELEAEPAPETRALMEEVRGREEVSGAAVAPAPPPEIEEAAGPAESPALPGASKAQRPRPRTRERFVGALLAILLLVGGGWWMQHRNGTAEPNGTAVPSGAAVQAADVGAGAEPDPRSIAVAVFENRTGDPELDLVGRLASERIARGLLETGRFRVLTPATLYRVAGPLPEATPAAADSIRQVARATGASTIVHGGYHRSGDSLVIQARITDVAGARLLHVTEPVRAGLSAPEEGIEILRERVVAALATLRGEDTERWAGAASKPPTLAAFREWNAGIEAHTRGDLQEGLRRSLRAGDLDPAFHQPALWALFSAFDLGRHAVVDSLLARLVAVRDGLPPFDQAMLELHLAYHDSDFPAYHRAASELLRLAPDSEFRYKAAYGAMALNRPEEALGHLRKADPDHGWLRNWGGYWRMLTQALHRLERHTEELEAARDYRAREPGHREALLYEAKALAALGDLSAVAGRIEELKHAEGPVRLWHMLVIAAELEAHGFARAADQTRSGIVEWYASLSQQRRDDGRERSFAFTLCLSGRTEEGMRRLQAVLTSAPMAGRERQVLGRERQLLSDLGVCAALAGDRETALAYEHRLAERTAAAADAPDPHNRRPARELYLVSRAIILAHVEERDRAFALLEQAVRLGLATRGPYVAHELHFNPKFRPLWGDPAFEALLERVHAPPHRPGLAGG